MIAADQECCDTQLAGYNSGCRDEKALCGICQRNEEALCQWIVAESFRHQHISEHNLTASRQQQRVNFGA
jgi:hypothetical protein